jgi:hypothetical protein
MTHRLVLIGVSLFAMSGSSAAAHATSLEDLCNQEDPITQDTKIKTSGDFSGDCRIEVDDARLEIRNVTLAINADGNGDDGELRIDDVTEEGGAAELVIKNANITTGDRLRIEGAWDGGVILKNSQVDTGDDLRIRLAGSGDLVFKNNRGQVVDDIRLGDAGDDGGLNGDMDVRNNRITMVFDDDDPTELLAQSFDGDINVRNNRFEPVRETEITSFGNGDLNIRNNLFGDIVELVEIQSTGGSCESKGNSPSNVNDVNNGGLACM